MFSLVIGFYRWMIQGSEWPVLIVGLDGSGKTALTERAKVQMGSRVNMIPLNRIAPTVGLNVSSLDLGPGRRGLILWDVGGAASLRVLWEKYYMDAAGILFAVNALERERWPEALSELTRLLADDRLSVVPVCVVLTRVPQNQSREVLDAFADHFARGASLHVRRFEGGVLRLPSTGGHHLGAVVADASDPDCALPSALLWLAREMERGESSDLPHPPSSPTVLSPVSSSGSMLSRRDTPQILTSP